MLPREDTGVDLKDPSRMADRGVDSRNHIRLLFGPNILEQANLSKEGEC